MQSKESEECQKKCAVEFDQQRAYCEAAFSPDGKTPNAIKFQACAIAALGDQIDCIRKCLERPT